MARRPLLLVGTLAGLLACAGVAYSGPEEPPGKALTWRIEALRVGDGKHAVIEVVEHGDTALLVADTGDFEHQVWIARGEVQTPVKFKDGSLLRGDFISTPKRGNPAVFTVSDYATDTRSLVVVADGVPQTLLFENGKPADGGYFFNSDDGVNIAEQWGETEEEVVTPLYVLEGNVLRAIKDKDGKHLQAELTRVQKQPNGRFLFRRARVVEVDGEADYIEDPLLWLDGSKVSAVDDLITPEAWKADNNYLVPLFFSEHTLVVGSRPYSARAWIVKDDKTEWVVDAEGKPLSYELIYAQVFNDVTYLFCADKISDPSRVPVGFVYRLEGTQAVQLKVPEGKRLGRCDFEPAAGLGLIVTESEVSTPELWMIDGDSVCPITTEKGKNVCPVFPLNVAHVGGMYLVTYDTPQGPFHGRLDGTVVKGIGESPPVKASGLPTQWFDLDGEILFCAGSVARLNGGKPQWLELPGQDPGTWPQLHGVQSGNVLYLSQPGEEYEDKTYILKR